ADEGRVDPVRVADLRADGQSDPGERRLRSFDFDERLQQRGGLALEAGADLAREHQAPVLMIRSEPERAELVAHRSLVAADHEFLALDALDLLPGRVARVGLVR